jgi:hypothetical protein
MEKTPAELREQAAELLRKADEIEQVGKEQESVSPKPQSEDQESKAEVGPAYGKWRATTICSHPDKKDEDE